MTVGLVNVLLVKVWVDPRLTKVSDALGNVYVFAPATVNVEAKFPEIVMVLAALLATPVPPFAGANMPVMSAVNDTALNVGAPDALPCKTCADVPAAVVANAVVVVA